MVQISLPVSSFSKKIVLHDYPSTPAVHLRKGDELLYILLFRHPKGRVGDANLRLLSERLPLVLGQDTARHVQPGAAGWFLHQMHLHRMMQQVRAFVSMGMAATQAIEHFYAIYGLGEDDFAFESAYKRWQRFCTAKPVAKKEAKIGTLRRRGVHQIDTLELPPVPLSEEALCRLKADFLKRNPRYLLTTANRPRKTAEKQLDAYLHLRLARRSAADIRLRLGVSRKNVFYSSAMFERFLRSNLAAADSFCEVLGASAL